MNEWPKRCACGREHDPGDWVELRFVGYQCVPAGDDGPAERLELRDCPCESTLSIYVPTGSMPGHLLADLADVFRVDAARTRGDYTEWASGQFWRHGEQVRLDPNHYAPKVDEREAARLDKVADRLERAARKLLREERSGR